MDIHILSYARPLVTGHWTGTTIGYYTSLERLEEARERLRSRPGFRDYSEGFYVNSYRTDEDYDDPTFFRFWDPGRRPEFLLGEAVGVEGIKGPFADYLPHRTPLPASYGSLFPTGADGQTTARVVLVAGDPGPEGAARRLGELLVPDLPPAPRANVRIPIWVAVDQRGGVTLAARHPRTGEILSTSAGPVAVEPGGANPSASPDPA